MKIKIFTLITLFTSLFISAQNQCFDPNWNWEDPSEWNVYYPDGVFNYSPYNVSIANNDIKTIIESDDLKKINGWVLLDKQLGCSEIRTEKPHVIFYNRFTGVMRVMATNTPSDISTKGLLTAQWGSGAQNRSSLLTHTNSYSRPNIKYPAFDNDKVANTIANFSSRRDSWWVTEFQVAFDSKTKSNQTGTWLQFKVYNITDSTIELNGTIDLLSESVQIKGTKEEKTPNGKNEWLIEAKEVVEKLKPGEWSDYLKDADKQVRKIRDEAITNSNESKAYSILADATTVLAQATGGESKANEVLKAIAKNAPIVGSVIGIAADLFGVMGKASNTVSPVQIAPFKTTGTIVQSGTIKTSTQNTDISLNLPGINPDSNTYYKCSLGVVNVENNLEAMIIRSERERIDMSNVRYGLLFNRASSVPPGNQLVFRPGNYSVFGGTSLDRQLTYIKENWKIIRLRDYINLSVNSASKMRLIKASVALTGKVESVNGEVVYDLLKPNIDIPEEAIDKDITTIYGEFGSAIGNSFFGGTNIRSGGIYRPYELDDQLKNTVANNLGTGVYSLLSGGEDLGNGEVNKQYKFRTKYVDIENVKDLILQVREETTVGVKIIAQFEEIDNPDAPLFTWTNEYIVDEPTRNTSTKTFFNRRGVFSRKSRQFTPTTLYNMTNYYKDGVSYKSPQNCDCVVSNTSAKNLITNLNTNQVIISDEEKLNLEKRFVIFPNPVLDKLTVSYKNTSEVEPSILISDFSGKIIVSKKLKFNTEDIDFSNYPSGVYVVTIIDSGKYISKKLIKE